MKNRNIVSVLLYLLGVILFLISNSSIVSGSPIHLDGYYGCKLYSLSYAGGEQTNLRGHIMALACKDIANAWRWYQKHFHCTDLSVRLFL